MRPLVIAMPGNEALGASLAAALPADRGSLEHRRFPDGESYLRFLEPVKGRDVVLACTLNDPDGKALSLFLAARALRDLGAARIGLVAPYLAYMRQDRRFKEGEAVTSAAFAQLLSIAFDWLVTIDPHLHRYHSMSEIYTAPVVVGHAASILADYLRTKRGSVFLVGPDEESEQWVAAVGASAGVPHVTMRKTRTGDREVSIAFSGIESFRGLVPVLVDDIISSGFTMEVAVRQLRNLGFPPPVCLAVHGILAENAMSRLEAAGAEVVTTNTIPGPSSVLDVGPLLAALVRSRI